MASLDGLKIRKALRKRSVGQVGTNTPVAIRLRWLGDGAVTSVTVTTATNIVMIGVDGGTSYTQTYPFAAGLTLNTMGELVDAINNANCTETSSVAGGVLWEAKILDSLRSHSTASAMVDGAIVAGTVDGVVVYDALVDTGGAGALHLVRRVSADRLFDKVGIVGAHRVGISLIQYYATITGAVDSLQIWKVKGTVETQLMGLLSVNNTLTTAIGDFAADEPAILSGDGEDLVVVLKDAAMSDATSNFLRVYEVIE